MNAGPAPRLTVAALRREISRMLGTTAETAALDARVIVAHFMGCVPAQLALRDDEEIDVTVAEQARGFARRRAEGEPVARLIGEKEFWGMALALVPETLVPRPDTETLVDEALARLRERAPAASPEDAAPPPLVADIGTGSGAIIVALGKQFPASRRFAVDQSAGALEVARANAARHDVAVEFLQGDLLEPLRAHGPFDLLAANLPYIPSAQLAGLPPEVRAEPAAALDGGPDGLELVRRLIAAAPALLARGGALVLEIGAGQAHATAELCAAAGFSDIRRRRDLGAIERVVSAVRA